MNKISLNLIQGNTVLSCVQCEYEEDNCFSVMAVIKDHNAFTNPPFLCVLFMWEFVYVKCLWKVSTGHWAVLLWVGVCVILCCMTSVCPAHSRAAGIVDCEQVLQLRFCELVLHSYFPCVFMHTCLHVWPLTCAVVCACGHKCKQVFTLTRVSDNVLLCECWWWETQ